MNCEVMLCPRHGFNPQACIHSLCQWDTMRPCGEPAVAIVGDRDPQIEVRTARCKEHLNILAAYDFHEEVKERLF